MANPKMTGAWFAKAAKDLRTAKVLVDLDDTFLEPTAYHAQQCVEKVIKGFLVFHEIKFERTHIIGELSKKAYKVNPDLKRILDPAKDFGDFVLLHRYPDATPRGELTKDVVLSAVKVAEDIYEELRKLVNLP